MAAVEPPAKELWESRQERLESGATRANDRSRQENKWKKRQHVKLTRPEKISGSVEPLAISPQCGFASSLRGNLLSEEEQFRKLDVMLETARKVWGL